MSVFNTPAPNLSKKEIQLIVQGNYKLSVDALNLTGERDQNFFLIDTSGNEYILKVFNSAEEVAVVEMQSQAMFHVAQLDSSIQVSSHVKTMDGSDMLEYTHENTAHMIRIVNNIPAPGDSAGGGRNTTPRNEKILKQKKNEKIFFYFYLLIYK